MQSGFGKIGKSFQSLGDQSACQNRNNTGGTSQQSSGGVGMKEVVKLKRCVVA